MPLTFHPSQVRSVIADIESNKVPLETISDEISGIVSGVSGRKFPTLMAKLTELMPEDLFYLEVSIYQA
jgi:hypothetical protein